MWKVIFKKYTIPFLFNKYEFTKKKIPNKKYAICTLTTSSIWRPNLKTEKIPVKILNLCNFINAVTMVIKTLTVCMNLHVNYICNTSHKYVKNILRYREFNHTKVFFLVFIRVLSLIIHKISFLKCPYCNNDLNVGIKTPCHESFTVLISACAKNIVLQWDSSLPD